MTLVMSIHSWLTKGIIMKTSKNNKKIKINDSYEEYLNNLLDLVKDKGILVEIMKPEDNFLLKTKTHNEYKECLGAVPVKDKSDNITNVYVVYEDYDGSIKYYDFPQCDVEENSNSNKGKIEDILFNFIGMSCLALICSLLSILALAFVGDPVNLQSFVLAFILSFLLSAVLFTE